MAMGILPFIDDVPIKASMHMGFQLPRLPIEGCVPSMVCVVNRCALYRLVSDYLIFNNSSEQIALSRDPSQDRTGRP